MPEEKCAGVKESAGFSYLTHWSSETWAFLILRLFLGLRLFTAGLGKFLGQDGFSIGNVEKFVFKVQPSFAQTWLPDFLVRPYLYVLPFCEVGFSVMLLAGIFTKHSLVLMGLLYTSLAFGQMLLPTGAATVSEIAVHLILVIVALMLVKHNRFEVC